MSTGMNDNKRKFMDGRWWMKGARRMELNGTVTNIEQNCDSRQTKWNIDCSKTK
jgi:hypothetical protein